MSLLALFMLLFGALLGRWLRVFVLFPATLLAWGAAANLGHAERLSSLHMILAAFLCGAGLQLGYVAGAVVGNERGAQAKKTAVVIARR